jgi:hypothetical protein
MFSIKCTEIMMVYTFENVNKIVMQFAPAELNASATFIFFTYGSLPSDQYQFLIQVGHTLRTVRISKNVERNTSMRI